MKNLNYPSKENFSYEENIKHQRMIIRGTKGTLNSLKFSPTKNTLKYLNYYSNKLRKILKINLTCIVFKSSCLKLKTAKEHPKSSISLTFRTLLHYALLPKLRNSVIADCDMDDFLLRVKIKSVMSTFASDSR